MKFEIGIDLSAIWAVMLALTIFGIAYNSLVAYLERRGYAEGFLSLIVAAGVFVTLAGLAVLSWQAALLALVSFTASGTPMIVGSIIRYLQKREEARRALLEELKR